MLTTVVAAGRDGMCRPGKAPGLDHHRACDDSECGDKLAKWEVKCSSRQAPALPVFINGPG